MSITRIEPEVEHSRTEEGDEFAHYARREEIVRASIEGGRVKALCGFEFEPVRDPSRFPVCPRCKELVDLANELG
jgi:predicted Zn-ribbon and HTH transcriptional regulator